MWVSIMINMYLYYIHTYMIYDIYILKKYTFDCVWIGDDKSTISATSLHRPVPGL